jgi:hypothetical protein
MGMENKRLSRGFTQCFNALGAQRLFYQSALLHHRNLLQIRLELAVGRDLGERAVMTESGRLSAGVALSHLMDPFLAMSPIPIAFSKARDFTI